MQVGNRKPGATTGFADSANDEVLLQIGADEDGTVLVSYRLYDAQGQVVAESSEFTRCSQGLRISAPYGDVLLDIPAPPGERISYRLYNRTGMLLTCSDGQRTQIFSFLRMQGSRK